MKVEQFSRKRYKVRQDLSGICVGYNMSWYCDPDAETEIDKWDESYCYDAAITGFHNDAKKLNDGEYFRRNIFGHWHLAYKKDGQIFYK